MRGNKKFLCWLVVALMFLTVISGGCGGGGSGTPSSDDSGGMNQNQSQSQNQNESQNDTTQENQTEQTSPSDSRLNGTWKVTSYENSSSWTCNVEDILTFTLTVTETIIPENMVWPEGEYYTITIGGEAAKFADENRHLVGSDFGYGSVFVELVNENYPNGPT